MNHTAQSSTRSLRNAALSLALGCAGLLPAGAVLAQPTNTQQAMTHAQYSAEKDKIKADHDAADDQCDAFSGNRKDVCQKEAKGRRDVALATLENQYKPGERQARKVREEQSKADYEVANEKCEEFSGDAKSRCEKQAKATYEASKASIR